MMTRVVRDDALDATYTLKLDHAGRVLEARVMVEAHDKVPTWRKLKHPVTLARLQRLAEPPAPCPTCGAEHG